MNTKLPGSLVFVAVLFSLCLLMPACQGPVEPIGFTTDMASVRSAANPSDRACAKRLESFVSRVTSALEGVEPTVGPWATWRLLWTGNGQRRSLYAQFDYIWGTQYYVEMRYVAPEAIQGDAPPESPVWASGLVTEAIVEADGSAVLGRDHVSDVPADVGNALGSNPNIIDDPADVHMLIDQVDCVISP